MGIIILLIGIVSYTCFFVTFITLIAFVGNLNQYLSVFNIIPWNIDSAPASFSMSALLINSVLIALFGLHHSIMARQTFKDKITQLLPKSLERSFYVFSSSLLLLIMMIFWQPITTKLWQIDNVIGQSIMWILFASGWGLVLLSSFLINHFDLFGLRQTYLAFVNKPYETLPFQIKSLYKIVRHPLYLGMLLGSWATPMMTLGHLILAMGFTLYIFIGVHFEEKDMITFFGDKYRQYQKKTAMIIPFFKK